MKILLTGLLTISTVFAGTNPQQDPVGPDSDGDGLGDAEEATLGSNPNNPDSDNDGAFDGWEVTTGYSPTSSASTPPTLDAFGLNFVSSEDASNGIWTPARINGCVPQTYWNQTVPLPFLSEAQLLIYDEGDSATPITNTSLTDPAVDANGVASPITFSIPRPDGMSAQSSFGRDNQTTRLFNGALTFLNEPSQTLDLAGINYANYDLYVYVSSIYKRATGDVATTTVEVAGNSQEISVESVSKLIPFRLPRTNTLGRPPFANVVKFENLTQGTLSIKITHDDGSNVAITSGIAAIQLVNRVADSDTSGIPDFWELMHGIGNTPTADPDNDSLNNLAEFQNGSDPNNPDTDDDGLLDGDEVTRGTNPSNRDTDGDRLSDFDEVNHPLPSDPLLVNSDGTGGDDLAERLAGTDPSAANADDFPTPQTVGSAGFSWELTNVRFIWNHDITLQGDVRNNGQTIFEASCDITNIANGNDAFGILIREEVSGAKYRFRTTPRGFRRQVNGTNANIEINGDTNITNLDLKAKMGFSGFGSADVSDRLTFQIIAAPEPDPANAPNWFFTARIINETTGVMILDESRSVTNNPNHGVLPADHLIDGTSLDFSIDITKGTAIQVLHTPIAIAGDFPDSDDDGISDTWESANGITDPLDDPDMDGLTNREEFFAMTNPNLSDSDGDGFNDREELNRFTDPNNTNIFPPANSLLSAGDGDFNGNGLRDSWEALFGYTNESQLIDSDGDGVSNKDESVAGTDPFDASSRHFLRAMSSINGQNTLAWPNFPNKTQVLKYSDQIGGFEAVSGTPTLMDGLATLTLPQLADGDFYRLEVSERDDDGDGVSNSEEAALGTSSSDANSSRRAAQYDSDNNGSLDATLPGDYLTFVDFFRNREGLANGSGSISPSERDAARLLMQATFGPTLEDIYRVRELGAEAWIDEQMSKTASTHFDVILDGIKNARGPMVDNQFGLKDFGLETNAVAVPFSRAAVLGEDQLRQRVAFALSQIFVVSLRYIFINARPQGLTSYYDIFVNNAFGNYADILREVSFHPVMGTYLSHVGNEKPDLAISQFPDENYAREVMQLFSIGLWELKQDGTRMPDINGNDIPTYDTDDITELARVMTGLLFANANSGRGSRLDITYTSPMRMEAFRHDFGEKNLLDGSLIIPARTESEANGIQDIDDALAMLFQHDNTPPFISKALIQFLVTNNPSPQYVSDIASIFIDNGSGVRGDLGAVVKAILMHREARDPGIAELQPQYGRLRDPLVRYMHLAKMVGMGDQEDFVWFDNGNLFLASGQTPLGSPSVFNFYQPDYSPPGSLTNQQLVGGPFQLLDSNAAVSYPNLIWEVCTKGYQNPVTQTGAPDGFFLPSFREALPFADDPEALLDYINLVVCGGKMHASTRTFIKSALETDPLNDPRRRHHRVSLALYAAFISAEGAVQR